MLVRVCLVFVVLAAYQPNALAQYMTPPPGFFDTNPAPTYNTGPPPTTASTAQTQDEEFDNYLMPEEESPKYLPTETETRVVYNDQRERLIQESYRYRDLPSPSRYPALSLYVKFFKRPDLYKDHTKCCNRTQGYGCQGRPSIRIPCFYDHGQWCCPLWNQYIANCNCEKCAVLSSPFLETGTCYRKYQRRTILAVCYSPWQYRWNYCRWISRYWPTSCYCKTQSRDCCS